MVDFHLLCGSLKVVFRAGEEEDSALNFDFRMLDGKFWKLALMSKFVWFLVEDFEEIMKLI